MTRYLRCRLTVIAASITAVLACGSRNDAPARLGPSDWSAYPRVLFLTTGIDGTGTLPSGANICLETFNSLGAFAEIAAKTVLLDSARLASARIIVAPTIAGYHDADRTFSLSYLDEAAMKNLAAWVDAGGILIAGENIGRNTIEGEDRVTSGGIIDGGEWPLARVFGYSLEETNLSGFRMVRNSGTGLLAGYREQLSGILGEAWLLVPVESTVAAGVRVLSRWTDGSSNHAAVTLNRCGRGFGIMVPFFLLLQPAVDGGAGDVPAITSFYRSVFALAFDGPSVFLNPWPAANRSVLAVTLNEAEFPDPAAESKLKRLLPGLTGAPGINRLDVFVTGMVPDEIINQLKREPRVKLASLSYSHQYFNRLDYCRTVWEIARLEDHLRQPLAGFRFPFSRRTAAGLFAIAQRGYRYESSVYIDHATGFAGALFPYNLPAWVKDQYCFITDVLELSPTVEDWEFYGAGAVAPEYDTAAQKQDARRFDARLRSSWSDIARARRGMMLITLHSAYSGYSDITLEPVMKLVAGAAAAGDAWFAGLDDIAGWWNARRNVAVTMKSAGGKTVLRLANRNAGPVRDLAIRLEDPGLNVQARGMTVRRIERTEEDGQSVYLVFDLDRTAELEVTR